MDGLQGLDGFLGSLHGATDLTIVKELVDQELKALGFDVFAYVQLTAPAAATHRLYLGTYPLDWSELYHEAGLEHHDPLYKKALYTLRPFLWADVRKQHRNRKSEMLLFGPAGEVGLKAGAGIPIHGPNNVSAALQIAMNDTDAAFGERFLVHQHRLKLIALNLHEAVLNLSANVTESALQLTPRQAAVLYWMSEGKSDWDISQILGISEDTVGEHAKRIFISLGVNSRNRAIKIGMRDNLILL